MRAAIESYRKKLDANPFLTVEHSMFGPENNLPVRVTTLSITESLFDERLNPTHATVELGFRVMTPKELDKVTGPFKTIASAAYTFSQHERETMALFNLSTTAGSLGLPPIPGV